MHKSWRKFRGKFYLDPDHRISRVAFGKCTRKPGKSTERNCRRSIGITSSKKEDRMVKLMEKKTWLLLRSKTGPCTQRSNRS